ncbi:LPS export ABC transporter protein LptC [Humidesulfovibrio mexicanus]|uniref:LPS export ABC transporter protein LptC n=1 Tax=Humidesulfovibrio mexicanus TaxID=147047 RepID=A0A238XQZ6_9BACT|nr:LPS export ABC transporter periplasmic protein LptC [Humidesulfovibrio mexicanus]SNR60409.1 LPS export ABC transporter protein LptC [Humidesulfovibrio mexicanus]
MRKPFFTVIVIFLLGLVVGLVVNMQRDNVHDAPAEKPQTKAEPDVLAEDLELVQGSDGKELWRIRATSAEYSLDQRIVQVIRPQLFAYVGPEREEVFIKSDLGEINQSGNTVTLRDNIAGRFGQFALSSDVFDYIGAMKKAYFKGRVIVTRPDFTVNATTVEINLETRELTAAGGVAAEFTPAALEGLKKEKKP